MILHTLDLRRYLVARIVERGGEASISALVQDLADDGFTVAGRDSKTISDALRAELARGRVVRVERGVYAEARIPKTTRYRILRVARRLRTAALEKKMSHTRGTRLEELFHEGATEQ